MNVLVVRTNVTQLPPAAETFRQGMSAPANRAINTYKTMTSTVKVSAFIYFSYLTTEWRLTDSVSQTETDSH